MKEFYLVPVQVYENLIIKQNTPSETTKHNIIQGGKEINDYGKSIIENNQVETMANDKVANMQLVTTIPPPSKVPLKIMNNQKKRKEMHVTKKKKISPKIIPLRTLNPLTKNKFKKLPNLREMLKIVIPNTFYDAAEGVLTWFENTNVLKWNKNGDLIYPAIHLNIVNIIGYIVDSKKKITNITKLDYIVNLLQYISFPPELVANKKIRDLLPTNSGEMINNRLVEFKPHTGSSTSTSSLTYAPSLPSVPITRQRQRANTALSNFSYTPPHSPTVKLQSRRVPYLNRQSPTHNLISDPHSDSEVNWQSTFL